MPHKKSTAGRAYNRAGSAYHEYRVGQDNFFNSYVEEPAIFKALGTDLRGRVLLDIGCGGGVHLSEYSRRGAVCGGIDISATLVRIAALRLPHCLFRVGSMVNLPYENDSCDIVTCSLALHYVKRKPRVFREVARVLKVGGTFIFTTGNPVMDARVSLNGTTRLKVVGTMKRGGRGFPLGSYFGTPPVLNTSTGVAQSFAWYPSTYEQLIRWALRAGFEIIGYSDCRPVHRARRLFPQEYSIYSRVPFFCLFHLRKRA
jgi:SAM-dependent methyltransferase